MDATPELGRLIVEAARLAVAMHTQSAVEQADTQTMTRGREFAPGDVDGASGAIADDRQSAPQSADVTRSASRHASTLSRSLRIARARLPITRARLAIARARQSFTRVTR